MKKKRNKQLTIADFQKAFAGIVLTAEPQLTINRNKTLLSGLNRFRVPLLLTGFSLVIMALLYNCGYFLNFNRYILLLSIFKTAGVIVSLLLLVQSFDSNNPLVQALCQGGSKTDCNAILSSKAAKVFDGLSWSEVGFFYFAGTWMLLLFGGGSPAILWALALLNFVSLPYTVYSIYYQARIAKKWCLLCTTVQALLWLEFVPLIIFVKNTPASFTILPGEALGIIFICLLTPVLLWLTLRPLLLKLQQLKPLKEQLRKFKYNSELFSRVLGAQPQYRQPDKEWSIVLGNIEAEHVITMVTNPYCPPCAKTHKLLDELLDQNDNLQARIVFTADNTGDDRKTPVARHLMALEKLNDKNYLRKAMHDWYGQKQKDYDAWANAYPVALIAADYYKLDEQKAWCHMAEVTATPTILINGHVLPDIYQLPDLKYMLQ